MIIYSLDSQNLRNVLNGRRACPSICPSFGKKWNNLSKFKNKIQILCRNNRNFDSRKTIP